MEDDALDKFLGSSINATLKLHKWRDSQPYDGVLGLLLEWVPDDRKDEFYKIRNNLLDTTLHGKRGSVEKIIRWISDYRELQNLQEGEVWRGFIPLEICRDISYLAIIQNAISLGEKKGLPLLAGADSISGARSRKGYKSRINNQAKLTFQIQAKPFFETNKFNIAKTIKEPSLSEFRRRNYGAHTLRDWLKEIRPEGKMQKGRPRKT